MSRYCIVRLSLLAVFFFGCGSGDPEAGSEVEASDPGEQSGGVCTKEGTNFIYLFDDRGDLLRYRPDTRVTEIVGRLDCEAGDLSPQSMAVDREGRAWVQYNRFRLDGTSSAVQVFPVDIETGKCLSEGIPLDLEQTFGMGFAFDADEEEDKLFITLEVQAGVTGTLREVQLPNFEIGAALTDIPSDTELSSDENGNLIAFGLNSLDPRGLGLSAIYRFAQTGEEIDVLFPSGLGEDITFSAFATAFWQGEYYLFLRRSFAASSLLESDLSSWVWRLNREEGRFELHEQNFGHVVVGAGASTCAAVPILE